MKPFAILDRDGTIIHERNYLSDPCQVELLPRAAEGLRRMAEIGYGLVVITNQSGIARRYFTEKTLERIHERMQRLLDAERVRLAGVFHCPHLPADSCRCRKPRPGLAERASQTLGFDLNAAVIIGDNVCDIDLGRRLQTPTILVRTGYGARVEAEALADPDFIVDDLVQAAEVMERMSCAMALTREEPR